MYPMSNLYRITDAYFQIGDMVTNQTAFRDHKRTNLGSCNGILKVNLENISRNISTMRDKDVSVDYLQWSMISSYYHNCPAKTTCTPSNASW
jgi:hypothetical protein